jgi:hypothetical protein
MLAHSRPSLARSGLPGPGGSVGRWTLRRSPPPGAADLAPDDRRRAPGWGTMSIPECSRASPRRGCEHDFVDALRVRIDSGKSGETDQAVVVPPATLMQRHMQPRSCRNAAAMKM